MCISNIKNNVGVKQQKFRGGGGGVCVWIIYIYIRCITKIVVLVSKPVRGRSRATKLPCYIYIITYMYYLNHIVPSPLSVYQSMC